MVKELEEDDGNTEEEGLVEDDGSEDEEPGNEDVAELLEPEEE